MNTLKSILMFITLVALVNAMAFNTKASEANSLDPSKVFTITLMDYPGALERYGKPLRDAYKKVGVSLEFIKLGHGISLQNTNDGRFDGDLMRAQGTEKSYPNLLPVGEPLIVADIVVLCQDSARCNNDLLVTNTIEVHSVAGAKAWNKAVSTSKVQVVYQESLAKLKQLFLAKKIDYMIYSLDSAGFFNAKSLNAQVMETPLLTVKTYHYIHKKHQALVADLAMAINQAFHKAN